MHPDPKSPYIYWLSVKPFIGIEISISQLPFQVKRLHLLSSSSLAGPKRTNLPGSTRIITHVSFYGECLFLIEME